MSVDEVGVFSFVVEDSEAVVCEELGKLVHFVVVFVQVIILGPDGVVEIEVSEEEGVGKEELDGFHGVDSRVVYVIVDVENQKGVGEGVDFEAHDVVGRDDI